ncbi:MAG: phosphoribosylglycinamide formyltransferase [Proteobacteria bacterium]|nr:phosphoribosylglycinamide formyltransferase [Pseudomonadota bacterium]
MTVADFRMAVLLSGAGSTMVNLHEKIAAGEVPGRIAVAVSSRKNALGLARASALGIPTHFLGRRAFSGDVGFDADAYGAALVDIVAPYDPHLVVMAGFMTRLSPVFLRRFTTVNVHPALLPMFGGEGFYGQYVHEAVLSAGVKITGATVHYADPEYDKGPILCQEAVPVLDDDTPETLAARVQDAERRIYPRAIRWIAEGRVRVMGHRTFISEP